MLHLNIEIKATCGNPDRIRKYLLTNGADFIGADEQTDTYFNCSKGRLKLRKGNIENNLIWYDRNNQASPQKFPVSITKDQRCNRAETNAGKSIRYKNDCKEKKRNLLSRQCKISY
jgi:adenylate cyclase class IV